MRKNMVVKVQRALFPPDANMLVYNEKRDFRVELPYEGPLKDAMGDEVKSFFEIEVDGRKISLVRALPDQGW